MDYKHIISFFFQKCYLKDTIKRKYNSCNEKSSKNIILKEYNIISKHGDHFKQTPKSATLVLILYVNSSAEKIIRVG